MALERLRLQPLAARTPAGARARTRCPAPRSSCSTPAQRAILPRLLLEQLEKECEEPGAPVKARAVYGTIELPLVPVLVAMEEEGILLDCAFCAGCRSSSSAT